jgi:hypothetical protein
MAGGRSDRDRLDDAHAVLGEHGHALQLKRMLAGWNAVVYPLGEADGARELVAHAQTDVVAAEPAVAYIRSRGRSNSRA